MADKKPVNLYVHGSNEFGNVCTGCGESNVNAYVRIKCFYAARNKT